MTIPRYFIWRESDSEPWQVYGTRRHYLPDDRSPGEVAWYGDDYQDALSECRRLNAIRRKERSDDDSPPLF